MDETLTIADCGGSRDDADLGRIVPTFFKSRSEQIPTKGDRVGLQRNAYNQRETTVCCLFYGSKT